RNAESDERARRADIARVAAEELRLTEKEAHEKQVADLQTKQDEALAKQARDLKRAPQPAVAPISMGEVVIQHAVGDLYSPRTAPMHTCSFSEACLIAAGYDAEKVGIWTKASGKLPAAVLVKGAAVASVM